MGLGPGRASVTVLVTRPQPEANGTARRLREKGHDVLVSPLLDIEPLPFAPPGRAFDAHLVTSPRAVAALERLPPRPAFCVGEATGARVSDMGRTVTVAPDARRLAGRIREARPGSVLHAAGAERAFDMEGALAPHGITVETLVVYRANPLPLTGEAARALREGSVEAVLLTSPRIARLFAEAWTALDTHGAPRCLALSPAVAEALHAAPKLMAEVAVEPNETALLDLV